MKKNKDMTITHDFEDGMEPLKQKLPTEEESIRNWEAFNDRMELLLMPELKKYKAIKTHWEEKKPKRS